MPTDEMYTVAQAALLTHVDEATIRLAIRAGELRAWALPGHPANPNAWLVRKSDLQRWTGGELKRLKEIR